VRRGLLTNLLEFPHLHAAVSRYDDQTVNPNEMKIENEIHTSDPETFVGVAMLLALVAALCYRLPMEAR